MFEDIFDSLFPLLKLALCVFGCCAFIGIMICCIVYLDSSTIDVTRYCPNCGIDLIERR